MYRGSGFTAAARRCSPGRAATRCPSR
jgi:hypothetical protein